MPCHQKQHTPAQQPQLRRWPDDKSYSTQEPHKRAHGKNTHTHTHTHTHGEARQKQKNRPCPTRALGRECTHDRVVDISSLMRLGQYALTIDMLEGYCSKFWHEVEIHIYTGRELRLPQVKAYICCPGASAEAFDL
eukprot:5715968-Amphidinium_carterae.1